MTPPTRNPRRICLFIFSIFISAYLSADPIGSIRLYSEPRAEQYVGQVINFLPIMATHNDALEFEYRFHEWDSQQVTVLPWGGLNWSWDTTGLVAGEYLVQLRARHVGSTVPYEAIAYKKITLLQDPVALTGRNIILIVADDLGYRDLGSYGNKIVRTPSLDALASEGIRFSQFYTNSPVCSPSRAAFMTGRFPSELDIHYIFQTQAQNQAAGIADYLDPQIPNIANELQSVGYTTAHFGKWHLTGSQITPAPPKMVDYGFDKAKEWHSLVDLSDEYHRANLPQVLVDESIQFISQANKPFFLNLWFVMPHAPLNPTPAQLQRYQHLQTVGAPYPGAQAIYYASVSALDAAVGNLIDYLKTNNLIDNTVILFVSDNGPETYAANNAHHSGVGSVGVFRGRKRSLYEGGLRVPFILRDPAATGVGSENPALVSGVDLLPTILEYAGVAIPAGLSGESFKAAVDDPQWQRHNPLLWDWRFGDLAFLEDPQINKSPMVAIREGNYKLLFTPQATVCEGVAITPRFELYDIDKDPQEIDNISNDFPSIASALEFKALTWLQTLPASSCSQYSNIR